MSLLDCPVPATELAPRCDALGAPVTGPTGPDRRRARRRRSTSWSPRSPAVPTALVIGFGDRPDRPQGHRQPARPRPTASAWPAPAAGRASRTPGWPPNRRSPRRARTRSPSGPTSAWCTTARSPTTSRSSASSDAPTAWSSTARTTPRSARGSSPTGSPRATTWRRRCGCSARRFDGFYTLLVSTADSFAVVRDAIACKPAIIAETDRWVAMASEYRALAELPGIDTARIFEPEPERGATYGTRDATIDRRRVVDLDVGAASSTPSCHAAGAPTTLTSHPTRSGAHAARLRARRRPAPSTIDGHVGYYCAGMNQQADGHRARQRRRRRRGEHDVRRRARQGRRVAVRGRHRARRPARHRRQRALRGAASR